MESAGGQQKDTVKHTGRIYAFNFTKVKRLTITASVYGETDGDLANLSYGLIAPTKTGENFGGWYLSADFSGQPCPVGSLERTNANINTIYYAKWSDAAKNPVDSVAPALNPGSRPEQPEPNEPQNE